MQRILSLVWFCCIAVSQSSAQHIRFQHLSSGLTLQDNAIRAFAQDSLGFLWLGTDKGIVRYDGYEFLHFPYEEVDTDLPRADVPISYVKTQPIYGRIVRAIAIDKQQNILVGTEDGGLTRINPTNFTVDRLVRAPVWKIVTDHRNEIWFIAGKEEKKFRVYAEDNAVLNIVDRSLNQYSASSDSPLLVDDVGSVWLGTTDKGLIRFDNTSDRNKKVFVHKPDEENSISGNVINTLYEDSRKNIWVGARNERSEFTVIQRYRDDNAFDTYVLNEERLPIRSFFESQDEEFWVWADKLYSVDRSNGISRAFDIPPNTGFAHSSNPVVIVEDGWGHLWFQTQKGKGLISFDPVETAFTFHTRRSGDPFGLARDEIETLFLDRSKTLWIGTFLRGANKLNRSQHKFNLLQSYPEFGESLSSLEVTALSVSRDSLLWIGTGRNEALQKNGGLDLYHPTKGFLKKYSLPQRDVSTLDHISTLHLAKSNVLWIGTHEGGLLKMAPPYVNIEDFTESTTAPQNLRQGHVSAIAEDDSASLWIGTWQGSLYKKRWQSQDFIPVIENDLNEPTPFLSPIRTIYADPLGPIWVGTNGRGMIKITAQGRQDSTYLEGLSITAILKTRPGSKYLWVGTYAHGLLKFDTQKGTVVDRVVGQLANSTVYAIQSDYQEKLWISGQGGITYFDPLSNTASRYTEEDGLQGNYFHDTSARRIDGTLFFGGLNGLNYFHPAQLSTNSNRPNTVITGIEYQDKRTFLYENSDSLALHVLDHIDLHYPAKTITFKLASLDFAAPSSNTYSYYLNGLDNTWSSYTNNRLATYTNLGPGNYELQFKSKNNSGLEGPVSSISIEVHPPWWQRKSMMFLWFLMGSVLIYAGVKKLILWSTLLIKRIETAVLSEEAVKQSLENSEMAIAEPQESLRQQVFKFIEKNYANSELKIEDIAKHVGLSKTDFYKRVKSETNKSPNELLVEHRMEVARSLLKNKSDFKIKEIAYKVGYKHADGFSKEFKKKFGVSPNNYRRKTQLPLEPGNQSPNLPEDNAQSS